MALDHQFFTDGIEHQQQFYPLYQAFLKAFRLTERQAYFTCYAEEENDDPEDWRELMETMQSQEPPIGFTPRVEVTLYPEKQRLDEGYDNMLRLIGFLLKAAPGNAAFYCQLYPPKFFCKEGKLTLFDIEYEWSSEAIAALYEGLAA